MATEIQLWPSEAHLESLRHRKRRREDAEPYNTKAARKKARTAGIKAAANITTVKPANKKIPFGLSFSGDSSSEFVTVSEDSLPREQNNIVKDGTTAPPALAPVSRPGLTDRRAKRKASKARARKRRAMEKREVNPMKDTTPATVVLKQLRQPRTANGGAREEWPDGNDDPREDEGENARSDAVEGAKADGAEGKVLEVDLAREELKRLRKQRKRKKRAMGRERRVEMQVLEPQGQ